MLNRVREWLARQQRGRIGRRGGTSCPDFLGEVVPTRADCSGEGDNNNRSREGSLAKELRSLWAAGKWQRRCRAFCVKKQQRNECFSNELLNSSISAKNRASSHAQPIV